MTVRIVLLTVLICLSAAGGVEIRAITSGRRTGGRGARHRARLWGAWRTRFLLRGSQLQLRVPHTYTGIAVSLLFLGRLAFRSVQVYGSAQARRPRTRPWRARRPKRSAAGFRSRLHGQEPAHRRNIFRAGRLLFVLLRSKCCGNPSTSNPAYIEGRILQSLRSMKPSRGWSGRYALRRVALSSLSKQTQENHAGHQSQSDQQGVMAPPGYRSNHVPLLIYTASTAGISRRRMSLYGGGTVHFQVSGKHVAGHKNARFRPFSREMARLGIPGHGLTLQCGYARKAATQGGEALRAGRMLSMLGHPSTER